MAKEGRERGKTTIIMETDADTQRWGKWRNKCPNTITYIFLRLVAIVGSRKVSFWSEAFIFPTYRRDASYLSSLFVRLSTYIVARP